MSKTTTNLKKISFDYHYGDATSRMIISDAMKKWTSELISSQDYYCSSRTKYEPKQIIYNDPATIVFWKDGTKTVVKRSGKEEFNPYTAFCAALAKKIFKTNSHVNRIVRKGYYQDKKTNQNGSKRGGNPSC